MPQTSKILVKTIRDNTLKWSHFCYISSELYEEFFRVTECKKSDFGAFLSVWVQEDFGESLSMADFSDILRLKQLVYIKYRSEYSELYALKCGRNPEIRGWLRLWVSQHMMIEIAARKVEGYE